MAKQYLYFFGDGQCEMDPSRKDILGGKGASLAAMSQAKLPVPPGFTISAECCPIYLASGGKWPEGLEEQVRQGVARLEQMTGRTFGKFPKPLLVSVRSGAAASMPGMMDTILNTGINPGMAASGVLGFWRVYSQFCQMFAKTVAEIPIAEFDKTIDALAAESGVHKHEFTEREYELLSKRYFQLYADKTGRPMPTTAWQALVECIEAVFRSWNSERAITYRKQHDIRGVFGTAVNVQVMFPSEISGILFTANPNDLPADEMVIESSYGLGEAVVSGDVTPDRFIVCRNTLALKKTVLGNKAHSVRALGDGTEHSPNTTSLTQEQLKHLADVGMKVEAYFKTPVDVEWGWADGRFNLLQARPIRGLEIARDVEVCRTDEIARLKAMAGASRRVWVGHNLGETLRIPLPLTWDIVKSFMTGDGGFGMMYKDFGYRPSDRVCKEGFLELICGRIYADPDRAAGLFWEGMPLEYDLEAMAKDKNVMEGPPSRFNAEKADGTFLLRLPGTIMAMIKSSRRMKRLRPSVVETFEKETLPPYLEYVRKTRAQDLTGLSTAGVIQELTARRRRVLDDFGKESLKPGFFGGMARGALEAILVQLLDESEGKRLAMNLTMGLEGDLTIEQNSHLFAVAHGQASMTDFLARYGHRTVGEMELAEPRWREDATYLEKILHAHRGGNSKSPEKLHEENLHKRLESEKQLPELLARYGGSSLAAEIELEMRDAQKMLPYRENGKHYLMMGYEVIRLALLELTRRWDLGRDIFYLHLDELNTYEQRKTELQGEIAQRKTRWQSSRRLELAEIIDSAELENLGKPRQYEAASELPGDAVAAGVFSGPARIVFDPKEARDIGTDYVLVCPSTDPGWTALFVNARGLIIERGGVLSHGAIVARDFGIPAVVCPDATRRIKDGATVRVDGNRGLITLVNNGA